MTPAEAAAHGCCESLEDENDQPAAPQTDPCSCVLRAETYLTSAIMQWEEQPHPEQAERLYHLKMAMYHLGQIQAI